MRGRKKAKAPQVQMRKARDPIVCLLQLSLCQAIKKEIQQWSSLSILIRTIAVSKIRTLKAQTETGKPIPHLS